MEAEATEIAASEGRNPFAASGFFSWWSASIVAGIGVGIQSVTVPIFVRDRVLEDERALAISAALVVQALPGALLSLVGGAIADRIERRRILVRTYGIAALVSISYVVLCESDVPEIWPVFPLAAIVGIAGAFTNPARQAMLPQLVSRTQLQNGITLGTMAFMAALQFIGPSFAGVMVDRSGLSAAFAAETLLLFGAAFLFSRIATDRPTPSGHGILTDLKAGLDYVRSHPTLRALLIFSTIPGIFFIGPFAVTLPILVPDLFGASDLWVGLLWGAFGAGVVIGSILLTIFFVPRRGLALCLSSIAGGISLTLYALNESLYIAAAILFVWGLGASVFINFAVGLIQHHTEPVMMGRVMSMYSLAFLASTPVGYAQAGLITNYAGPQTTLLLSGVVSGAIGLACLLFAHRIRALP